MDTFFTWTTGFLKGGLSSFNDPGTRLHWVYILSSFLIAAIFLIAINSFALKPYGKKNLLRLLFPKYIWLSRSAFVDYQLFFFNGLLKFFLIVPFAVSGTAISFEVTKFMIRNFDLPIPWDGPAWMIVASYTAAIWILGDFSRFFLHYLLHKIPFLWEFHKVHHSATSMNPVTLYRSHPLEMYLNYLRGAFIFGIVTGLFYYWFSYSLGLYEILGVNIGRFIFLSLGANLRHTHLRISYGKFLERIFISPAQHQIHHSKDPDDHHKNMGSHLAIWDWLFGTLKISNRKQRLKFGLGKEEDKYFNSFGSALTYPFKRIFRGVFRVNTEEKELKPEQLNSIRQKE